MTAEELQTAALAALEGADVAALKRLVLYLVPIGIKDAERRERGRNRTTRWRSKDVTDVTSQASQGVTHVTPLPPPSPSFPPDPHNNPLPPPTPASPLAREFGNPDHASAYERVRLTVRSAVAFDAGLRAIASGMHGPAYPWATIGQALVEMDAAGAKPTAEAVRGFCRRLANQPTAHGATLQERNIAALQNYLHAEQPNA